MKRSSKFLAKVCILFTFVLHNSHLQADITTDQNLVESGSAPDNLENVVLDDDRKYNKSQITKVRFGYPLIRQHLSKAYKLSTEINKVIIGQEEVAEVLQHRLVQYLQNFGTRSKDPVALHLVGLPGIGKSDVLEVIEKIGVPVVRYEAQAYNDEKRSFAADLASSEIMKHVREGTPAILLIDELDKVTEKEIIDAAGTTKPHTKSFIGAVNSILTGGKIYINGRQNPDVDVSNIFVITTMNFSPDEIQRFSREALNSKKQNQTPDEIQRRSQEASLDNGGKSFHDFTIEDFAKFHEWITSSPNNKYKIFEKLFRDNSIGRIAPNVLMMKPLSAEDYWKIAKKIIDLAIAKSSQTDHTKRLTVRYTKEFVSQMAELTVVPSSGARETVFRVDALMESLLGYGSRYEIQGAQSLDRPRYIQFHYDSKRGDFTMFVQEQKRTSSGEWSNGASAMTRISYNNRTGFMNAPEQLSITPPSYATRKEIKNPEERPLTKTAMLRNRFPGKAASSRAKGLANQIDEVLVDQRPIASVIEKEMGSYLIRDSKTEGAPNSMVLSGFPGIGKSALVELTGKFLNIPIVKINMQEFSGGGDDLVQRFTGVLQHALERSKVDNPSGKFILLLEELDKVSEFNDKGERVDRPVIAVIKELLNSGIVKHTYQSGSSYPSYELDFRNTMVFCTMNFAIDLFGFKADPRQTSIEDVREAWRKLKDKVLNQKAVLGRLFLPDTVDRILVRYHIVGPLTRAGYRKLIMRNLVSAVEARLGGSIDGNNNKAISVKFDTTYRKYLFDEMVIPSEGARHTAEGVKKKVQIDLEQVLAQLQRSADYSKKPLTITFGFRPGSATVVGKISYQESDELNDKIKSETIYESKVELLFPPIKTVGRIPEKLLLVSIHEFGHAFSALNLGLRFQEVLVLPDTGYVKFYPTEKIPEMRIGKHLVSDIYATLASRSLERIYLSKNPLETRSSLDITLGSSQDIMQATMSLYNLMFKLGYNPHFGVMDRMGAGPQGKYANFEDLPHDLVEKLGEIMRAMENEIVRDLLVSYDVEWFKEKIVKLARIGEMTEQEFYEHVERKYPGDRLESVGIESHLQGEYENDIVRPSKEVSAARQARHGLLDRTTPETLEHYFRFFESQLDHHFEKSPEERRSDNMSDPEFLKKWKRKMNRRKICRSVLML